MKSRPTFLASLSALAALLALALPAWAQTAGQARARELFNQGIAATRDGRHADAVIAYRGSYEAFPHPGTLVNLATAQEAAGRFVDALASWHELLERFVAVISADARSQALQRIAELERSVARVSVTSEPPGATLLRDGRELGLSPGDDPVALDPGEVVFEARLEGYEDVRTTVTLTSGENEPVVLRLAATAPEPAPPPTLVVESSVEGATVAVDDNPPALAPVTMALEPGVHRVTVVAPGHEPQTSDVDVPETGEMHLTVDLEASSGEEEASGGEGRGFWRGPWPYVIGGVLLTGAALGLGLGLGLDDDTIDPHLELRLR